MLSSLSFAQGMGGKSGIGGKAGFGGGVSGAVVPAIVQAKSCNTTVNAGTETCQFNSNTTTGHFIAVMGQQGSSAGITITCSDTVNTYTTTTNIAGGSSFANGYICIAPNITGGTTPTVTMTFTGNNSSGTVTIAEFSGVALASPQDVADTFANISVTNTTWTGTAITTATSGDLLLSYMGSGSLTSTCTAGAPSAIPTNGSINGGGNLGCFEWRVVGAATAYTDTFTLGTTGTGVVMTAAYKHQ